MRIRYTVFSAASILAVCLALSFTVDAESSVKESPAVGPTSPAATLYTTFFEDCPEGGDCCQCVHCAMGSGTRQKCDEVTGGSGRDECNDGDCSDGTTCGTGGISCNGEVYLRLLRAKPYLAAVAPVVAEPAFIGGATLTEFSTSLPGSDQNAEEWLAARYESCARARVSRFMTTLAAATLGAQ